MSHQDRRAGDGGKNQVSKGQRGVSSAVHWLPYGASIKRICSKQRAAGAFLGARWFSGDAGRTFVGLGLDFRVSLRILPAGRGALGKRSHVESCLVLVSNR